MRALTRSRKSFDRIKNREKKIKFVELFVSSPLVVVVKFKSDRRSAWVESSTLTPESARSLSGFAANAARSSPIARASAGA